MKKRHLPRRGKSIKQQSWVPFIDHRIFPQIFSFGHVKGIARIFLQVEIILALLFVIGTSIVVCISVSQ